MLTTTNLGLKKPQTSDASTALRTAIGDNADILETLTSAARVTSIPTTGLYNGREIVYVADGTNGLLWNLRYNASGSTYKWEFIGGSPLFQEILTGFTCPATTVYDDAASGPVGPTLTLPLAGDYEFTWGLNTADNAFATLQFGATLPTYPAAESVGGLYGSRTRRLTVAAAATVVKMVYVSPGGSAQNMSDRYLSVRPIRVA